MDKGKDIADNQMEMLEKVPSGIPGFDDIT